MFLFFSGKEKELKVFSEIQRTFPQGSNYWGTNLSQVAMAFLQKKEEYLMPAMPAYYDGLN